MAPAAVTGRMQQALGLELRSLYLPPDSRYTRPIPTLLLN